MHLDFNKYEESGCLPISIFYLNFSDWFRCCSSQDSGLLDFGFVTKCQHEAIMKPYFETNATSWMSHQKGFHLFGRICWACLCWNQISFAFLNWDFCCTDFFKCLGCPLTLLQLQVTNESQVLHFQKYNYWWGLNAKKVKKSVRNRLRWNEEASGRNVDQCCLFAWAMQQCKINPQVLWSYFRRSFPGVMFSMSFNDELLLMYSDMIWWTSEGDQWHDGQHEGEFHQWDSRFDFDSFVNQFCFWSTLVWMLSVLFLIYLGLDVVSFGFDLCWFGCCQFWFRSIWAGFNVVTLGVHQNVFQSGTTVKTSTQSCWPNQQSFKWRCCQCFRIMLPKWFRGRLEMWKVQQLKLKMHRSPPKTPM